MAGENVFRANSDGTYTHNNEQVSKDEFIKRKAATDAEMRRSRGQDKSKMTTKEKAAAAFDELKAEQTNAQEYRKGGAVKKRVAVKPSKTKVKAPVSVKPRSKTIKKR